jgi:hypothetical protein
LDERGKGVDASGDGHEGGLVGGDVSPGVRVHEVPTSRAILVKVEGAGEVRVWSRYFLGEWTAPRLVLPEGWFSSEVWARLKLASDEAWEAFERKWGKGKEEASR